MVRVHTLDRVLVSDNLSLAVTPVFLSSYHATREFPPQGMSQASRGHLMCRKMVHRRNTTHAICLRLADAHWLYQPIEESAFSLKAKSNTPVSPHLFFSKFRYLLAIFVHSCVRLHNNNTCKIHHGSHVGFFFFRR